MLLILLFISALLLAYANGANDNFKGVATLYGSEILGYKTALVIATVATLLGSICAIFLAQGLIASFSGQGLVPQDVTGGIHFLIAVGFGAACTVLLATFLGFPISTTHSLVGGLIGAGLVAAGTEINFSALSGTFLIPLLVSPFVAFISGFLVYKLLHFTRKRFDLSKETCICIGEAKQYVPLHAMTTESRDQALRDGVLQQTKADIVVADKIQCAELYTDRVWGLSLQKLVDMAHIFSAATVSFARGLNDTPKIAALLVAIHAFDIDLGLLAVGIAMALGGILNAARVAKTISKKITSINHGQGFSANLVTSFLVIIASKLGIPVSTTHVSVGSLFGISRVSKTHDNKVIMQIILSWLVTLPVAMMSSGMIYWFIN